MISFLTVLFVISSVFLTLLILIQPGKGGGIVGSGAMGQQVFGGGGASSFIEKLTTWTAVVFMGLALLLSYLSVRSGDVNSLKEASEKQAQQALIDQAKKLLEQQARQPAATAPATTPATTPGSTTTPASSVTPPALPNTAPTTAPIVPAATPAQPTEAKPATEVAAPTAPKDSSTPAGAKPAADGGSSPEAKGEAPTKPGAQPESPSSAKPASDHV